MNWFSQDRIFGFQKGPIVALALFLLLSILALGKWTWTWSWTIYACLIVGCTLTLRIPTCRGFRLLLGISALFISIVIAYQLDYSPWFDRLFGIGGLLGRLNSYTAGILQQNGFGVFSTMAWRINLLGSLLFLFAYSILHIITAFPVKFSSRRNLSKSSFWDEVLSNLALTQVVRLFAMTFTLLVLLAPPLFVGIEHIFDINLYQDTETIIWIGSYIAVWELAAAFSPKAWKAPTQSSEIVTPAPTDKEKDIRILFEHHVKRDGQYLLLNYSPQDASTSPPATDDSSSARYRTTNKRAEILIDRLGQIHKFNSQLTSYITPSIDQLLKSDEQPPSLILTDALTESHYALFTELILDCLDHGGVALVVCPDTLTDDVVEALDDALERSGSGLLINRHVVGRGAANANELFNLIILPETLFDPGFLSKKEDFEAEIRRLRLLLFVEMQNLDLPRLKLHLSVLWYALNADEVRLVTHCTDRKEAGVIAENTLHGIIRRGTTEISLWSQANQDYYRLVWSNGEATKAHLRQQLVPTLRDRIDPLALLAIDAINKISSATVYDPRRRHYGREWQHFSDLLSRAHQTELAIKLRKVTIRQHLYGRETAPVILIEDGENLPVSLHRNYTARGHRRLLVEVVCTEYPLRDFFLWRIEQDCQQFTRTYEHFLPISPLLRAGITELIYALYPQLISDYGLRQSTLETILERLPNEGLLDALDIGPNADGLSRLFSLQNPRQTINIQMTRDTASREANYSILPRQKEAARIVFDLPVAFGGHPDDRYRLDRSDCGLIYGESTFIQIENTYYRINTITERIVDLEAGDPVAAGFEGRPYYVFAREFRLDFREQRVAAESVEQTKGSISFVRAHLHACFKRVTFGFYELSEGIAPFGATQGDSPPFNHKNGDWCTATRNYKSILHLHAWDCFPADTDELSKGRIAFTIGVVLHDVITSLFPGQAHRITVVSDQAKPLLDSVTDPLALFLRRRYGTINERLGDACERWLGKVRDYEPTEDRLDIYLIEDADHDLGIVRAIDAAFGRVFQIAEEYMDWLIQQRQTSSNASTTSFPPFHRFGADKESALFDWEGARKIVSGFAA